MLFRREATWKHLEGGIRLVDVATGQLLVVAPGRSGEAVRGLARRHGLGVAKQVIYAALDLSGPDRSLLDTMPPKATQVADPFQARPTQ